MIESQLETTLQYPDQVWNWGVYQLPVDYSNPNGEHRCNLGNLGKKLLTFDDTLGLLTLPGNESSKWFGNIELTGMAVACYAKYISTKHLNFLCFSLNSETGEKGIFGKSLVLFNPENNFRICGTIITLEENIDHTAEARFHSPIAGSIYFRWLAAKETDHHDTLIHANLFHVRNISERNDGIAFTSHRWKIFTTDIFDTNADKPEINCNILQIVYDPKNLGNGKSIGDIDNRVGQIKVSSDINSNELIQFYHDEQLVLLPSDLNGAHRQLFIVIYDHFHTNNFLACAKIRNIRPRIAK